MTRSLNTLVRLREMELDGLRREVAVFYRELDAIEDKQVALSQQLIDEQVYLTRMEGIASYAHFAKSARDWQAELEEEKRTVEAKITSKMMQITQAFEALKTAEIARDKAVSQAAGKIAKAEQDSVDEAALTRFMREQQGS